MTPIKNKTVVPAGIAGAKTDVTFGDLASLGKKAAAAAKDVGKVAFAISEGRAPAPDDLTKAVASSTIVIDGLNEKFDFDFKKMGAVIKQYRTHPDVESGTLAVQSAMESASKGKWAVAIGLIKEAGALFLSALRPAGATASTFSKADAASSTSGSGPDQRLLGAAKDPAQVRAKDVGYGDAAGVAAQEVAASKASKSIALESIGPVSVEVASQWLVNAPDLRELSPEVASSIIANLAQQADGLSLVNGQVVEGQGDGRVSAAKFEALKTKAMGDLMTPGVSPEDAEMAGTIAGLATQLELGMLSVEAIVRNLAEAIADPDGTGHNGQLTSEQVRTYISKQESKNEPTASSYAQLAKAVFAELLE